VERAASAPLRHPRPEYGISYIGGPGFRDDVHRVALTDLGLRATERFAYHYDFTDDWRLDLRVEQIMAAEVGRSYPRCTGGRRAGAPEGCGGPWAFLEQTQPHRVYEATLRARPVCCRCSVWSASTAAP